MTAPQLPPIGDLLARAQNLVPSLPGQVTDIPPLPEFHAALPLARALGADPHGFLGLVASENTQRDAVAEIIAQAQGIIGSHARGIVDAASGFLDVLRGLLPAAYGLHPVLGGAAQQFLHQASAAFDDLLRQQPDHLRQALAPLSAKLHEVVGHSPGALGANIGSDAGMPTALSLPATSGSGGSDAGSRAAAVALSAVGTPYVWGGTGGASGGFDCSGLTQWAWRQAGVELPRLAEHQTVGRPVNAAELIPGDLVVWDGHVAMYTGDGRMVEAGDPVQVNPLRTSNMGMGFKGFYRPVG